MQRPLIAITTDIVEVESRERTAMYPSYARSVAQAGGVPVLLPHEPGTIVDLIERVDGFVFTGGDDPRMEEFGVATDPRATLLHPDRQRFEVELLRQVLARDKPILGVCLGMQLLALVSRGMLDQQLGQPEAGNHWEQEHAVQPEAGASLCAGMVLSRHRQAVSDAGVMRVLARSPDGVIEAIGDPERRYCLGVQWHPERTREPALGSRLFEALVAAAESSRALG